MSYLPKEGDAVYRLDGSRAPLKHEGVWRVDRVLPEGVSDYPVLISLQSAPIGSWYGDLLATHGRGVVGDSMVLDRVGLCSDYEDEP